MSQILSNYFCLQTAAISYDYLTAFKHVEYGTEEYWAVKSKVDGWFRCLYLKEDYCVELSAAVFILLCAAFFPPRQETFIKSYNMR